MLPNREVKPENAAKMAIYGLFPLCGNGKGVPNRKKVAKTSGFLFLQWEDRHDRARLNTLFAYSGISPHRFESFAPGNATKKTARRRFRSQKYGWASRIRTYITGTKNQGPAIGRWPSVCHKAFCDYNVSGMVKPNKQPIRQNATTQYEYHLPYTGKGEPIVLLAPKTLRRLRQQR